MKRFSAYILAVALAGLGVTCGGGSSSDSGGSGCLVTSISPDTGDPFGGEMVTITGVGFGPGMRVVFGTTEGTAVNVLGSTSATVMTPFSPVDLTVDVTVILSTGQTCALKDAFTFNGPCAGGACPGCLLGVVDPAEGPELGGATVTIVGAGFFPGALVVFGTRLAPDVVLKSSNEIQARTPSSPIPGPVDVSVINPLSTAVCTLEDGYTYGGGCAVSSVSPGLVCPYISETIFVTGNGFQPGAGVHLLDNGVPALTAAEVRVLSDTQIEFQLPTPITVFGVPFDVQVQNPDGLTCFLPDAVTFEVGLNPPPDCSVTGLNPPSGPVAGGTTVIISGTGLVGTDRVFFGLHEATSVTLLPGGELEVVTPPASAPGSAPVNIIDVNCSRLCLPPGFFTYQ